MKFQLMIFFLFSLYSCKQFESDIPIETYESKTESSTDGDSTVYPNEVTDEDKRKEFGNLEYQVEAIFPYPTLNVNLNELIYLKNSNNKSNIEDFLISKNYTFQKKEVIENIIKDRIIWVDYIYRNLEADSEISIREKSNELSINIKTLNQYNFRQIILELHDNDFTNTNSMDSNFSLYPKYFVGKYHTLESITKTYERENIKVKLTTRVATPITNVTNEEFFYDESQKVNIYSISL